MALINFLGWLAVGLMLIVFNLSLLAITYAIITIAIDHIKEDAKERENERASVRPTGKTDNSRPEGQETLDQHKVWSDLQSRP